MGGNGGVEDNFAMPFQSAERAGLVGAHEAGIADYVGSENRRELTVDAFLGHVFRLSHRALTSVPQLRNAPFGKIHGSATHEKKLIPF
jgi:hypothetical protein